MQFPTSTTTRIGVVTRTLGSLIYVWPLGSEHQNELVFHDTVPISTHFLRGGDWVVMEVGCNGTVTDREKIEPVLPTFVSAYGTVRVKTRLYFPSGFIHHDNCTIGYSDDFGYIGVFFRCSELKAVHQYDVWVARTRRRHTFFEKQYNVHWYLTRQTLIPVQYDFHAQGAVQKTSPTDSHLDHFNNTLTNIPNITEIDFTYAFQFNDRALQKFYRNAQVREVIRQQNIELANLIELYLNSIGAPERSQWK